MTEAQQNKARTIIDAFARWRDWTAIELRSFEKMARELNEELKTEEKPK